MFNTIWPHCLTCIDFYLGVQWSCETWTDVWETAGQLPDRRRCQVRPSTPSSREIQGRSSFDRHWFLQTYVFIPKNRRNESSGKWSFIHKSCRCWNFFLSNFPESRNSVELINKHQIYFFLALFHFVRHFLQTLFYFLQNSNITFDLTNCY